MSSTELKIAGAKGNQHIELETRKAPESELRQLRSFCASLTGATRNARHGYLKTAMDHFVPTALQTYISDGPMGDAQAMKERPDDPQVQAWRDDALKRLDAHISSGRQDALLYAPIGYGLLQAPRSASEEYSNYLASNHILNALTPGAAPYAALLEGLAQGLSPAQRAEAQARADAIVGEWKKRDPRGRPAK